VQAGFGRTGAVWAFENYGVEPDIFTAGKSIAGGLPIGVAVVRREYGDVFEPGEHGSTFAGNPLTMAAAKAGVEVLISEDVPSKARALGERFMRILEDEVGNLKPVLRIKGLGLMLGVELKKRAEPYVDKLIGLRLLTSVAGGTTIRLLPPYCINDDDINLAVTALKNALAE
jgi:acetylornithine aminotransferase (EC 2.6.1.11)/N2-acetyl-L-lysine aminotransferase (EC 2.6.1.-)